ncbi:EGF-like repeat and discoidin I-like domain-containing protein 3 isoform X1 [Salvelinus fontinalis]|uniref:EGF-like repeat and discoidin I-like domain-containing protein 3 isoform X1 n=1 Tax=Salvelinus fontinalis TaxID=8038 RepID=UPI0024865F8C|nr:EGF-like repeat and discoidin I-like domain-containing protein 3 isoform X1 [Salvelinus fontinalis]
MLPLLSLAVLCIGAAVPRQVNGDECEPVSCESDADCFTPQSEEALLLSTPDWEEPITAGPCQPNPCHHGGVCEATNAQRGDAFLGYHCHCSPGYSGAHCQHNVNECESGPCRNGGVCTDREANYTCVCPGEYTGRNCQHKCSGPLGMEGGIITKGQLSSSSAQQGMFGLQHWSPELARLHRRGMVNAWSPAVSDRWPWIQVNLRQQMRVTGLITQGARRLGSSEYVKSYKIAHSDDARTWSMVKARGDTQDMIFHGNSDSSSLMANAFSSPIEAQYIRVYPQVCRGHCMLRMELMGCELTGCSEPLGLKGGEVQDFQLTSSSVYRTLGMGLLAWTPNRARLDNQAKVNAWTAATNDQNQWIQVDLLVPTKVTGVVTQGAKDFGRVQFVRSYKLAYSNDGLRWTTYQDQTQHKDKVFQGNVENDTHRKNSVQPPIYGRFLRLIPWSWYGRITLRMELLGCTEDD